MDNLTLYGTPCETCGKQADKYSFTVEDVAKIDLNRIVREQYEMGNLVTLLTDGKEPKGLLVHKEFLVNFNREDRVSLNGGDLSPLWGDFYPTVQYFNGSYLLLKSRSCTMALKDASFMSITGQDIVPKIKEELAAARAFVRRIKVVVHSL